MFFTACEIYDSSYDNNSFSKLEIDDLSKASLNDNVKFNVNTGKSLRMKTLHPLKNEAVINIVKDRLLRKSKIQYRAANVFLLNNDSFYYGRR